MLKKKIVSGTVIVSLLLLSLLFSSLASAARIDISVDEVYEMLQENPDDIILLDTRPESIYNSEHITGPKYHVVNIPLSVDTTAFESGIEELDKSKIVIAYCQAGRASQVAGDLLVKHDFERVYTMIGGINAWKEKYPTTLTPPTSTKAPTGAIAAPPFTLTSVDGTTFSIEEYRGKVVVLTLILTTCHLCQEEMGVLAQLRQAYPDVAIITVSIDPMETDENLQDFKEQYNADWLFARDTNNIASRYQGYVLATPTIVVITPEGYISFRKVEVVPLEDLKSAIESAYQEEGDLIPTATPTPEDGQIPGFEATAAIAIVGILGVSQWLTKRKKGERGT
jgi:cytochrome c biogenesis protein CcmG/thiol:disulfide interchange protein DsbE